MLRGGVVALGHHRVILGVWRGSGGQCFARSIELLLRLNELLLGGALPACDLLDIGRRVGDRIVLGFVAGVFQQLPEVGDRGASALAGVFGALTGLRQRLRDVAALAQAAQHQRHANHQQRHHYNCNCNWREADWRAGRVVDRVNCPADASNQPVGDVAARHLRYHVVVRDVLVAWPKGGVPIGAIVDEHIAPIQRYKVDNCAGLKRAGLNAIGLEFLAGVSLRVAAGLVGHQHHNRGVFTGEALRGAPHAGLIDIAGGIVDDHATLSQCKHWQGQQQRKRGQGKVAEGMSHASLSSSCEYMRVAAYHRISSCAVVQLRI